MGGGTTYSAVEHRIRPIKQLGKMQLEYVKQNRDPAELPVDKLGRSCASHVITPSFVGDYDYT